MKTVKTRDSAVAMLRKLGVHKDDYKQFITKLEDGRFQVEVTKAKAFVEDAQTEVTKPKGVKIKPVRPKRVTTTSVTEELIQAGKSNTEVWAVIKEKFKLSDDKRWYPSWFRSRLKRKGKSASPAKKK